MAAISAADGAAKESVMDMASSVFEDEMLHAGVQREACWFFRRTQKGISSSRSPVGPVGGAPFVGTPPFALPLRRLSRKVRMPW